MRITISSEDAGRRSYGLHEPIDISIPLKFNGPQPNAFGVEPARAEPVRAGSLVGDTRLGGSCNFEQYTFIPHCTGTHTECVGHITKDRVSIRNCLKDAFIPARLVTVDPVYASTTDESYVGESGAGDRLITKAALRSVLGLRSKSSSAAEQGADLINTARALWADAAPDSVAADGSALIIRTLPNGDDKLTRTYDSSVIPPYFTSDAMIYMIEAGFKHLLVDLPSIDRLIDGGKLANHRIFWNVPDGDFQVGPDTRVESTITELAYIPEDVSDGEYLLNLQIAPFDSDAAPSRPILFMRS